VGRIAGKVARPILIALQIVDALELVEMTESAVSGNGFIFGKQIHQASGLATEVDGLIKAYREANYTGQLAELVETAQRNDERYSQYDVTPEKYWGTEELSEFCLEASTSAREHVNKCSQLLDHLRRVNVEVSARLDYCERVMGNPATVAILISPTSAPLARVYAASKDLQRISDILPAPGMLAAHLDTASKDLEMLDVNILQTGWAV
jgi:hypothetical protein